MHSMHSLLTATSVVLLASLAAATGDIALSQFTPRIDNLPTQCKAVYNTKIDGCVSSDFALGATCSAQCYAGLARIGASVKTECRGVDVGETSIIGVFQNDLGVAALCPNNRPTTTSTSPASPSSSNAGSTTRTTLQTSSRASTPVTSTAIPPTSTVQPPNASSSGLAIDTTATQATSTSFQFNDPTAAPTASSGPIGNSQLSNSDSGGGSPFDVVATGAAGQIQITKLALASSLAAIVFVACL